MPSFAPVAVSLALAGGALAQVKRGDACAAAVTGSAALGDANLRKSHCASFFSTIVTPSAVTVTTTITGAPEAQATGWGKWKRDVTVCPNEVPNYASACNTAGYASACKAWGITSETTITIPATTTTKTIYVPTGAASCTDGKATVTVTVTAGGNGPTTTGGSVGPYPTNCISDSKAQFFADGFKNLLEYTSYNGTQGPPGRGYNQTMSNLILATDFQDYSDSINWMAGIPLGSVTFPSKAAFDQGQGYGQPELSVKTLNLWHSCNEITWRWQATTPSQATVVGINQMILNADHSKIQTNYAEFDNAAWLQSFGLKCSTKDIAFVKQCEAQQSASTTTTTTAAPSTTTTTAAATTTL